jgi:hypothetical protein
MAAQVTAPTHTSLSAPSPRFPPRPATFLPSPTLSVTSTPAATPGATHIQVARPTSSTEEMLAAIQIPVRDRLDLTRRLQVSDHPIPAVVNPTQPTYSVGDRQVFWVGDNDAQKHFQAEAVLRYVGTHSYWWVQDGFDVSDAEITASAQAFESKICLTDRAFFGQEWSPGVDNDPRIHIFIGNVPGVSGYFYSADEYSRLINPYSNEKEMFYINVQAVRPGTDALNATLAHEFQHMIHWHNDANEDAWVNEGLSELAMKINGYGTSGGIYSFTAAPDTQLDTWGDRPDDSIAHYGASFLFMEYFLERFGEATMRQVVAEPANGADGFDAALEATGQPYRFDDVFADWVVANYLDDPSAGNGSWGYRDVRIGPIALDSQIDSYPADKQSSVKQYAAEYLVFTGHGELTLDFSGATQVKIAPTEPHSGAYTWWSNRGDDSDMTLTHRFDLSKVDRAALQFWTWYDIENGWDFAYVEASADGGNTWKILPGLHTTAGNQSGNNFGQGWTGISGGGDIPEWVQEKVDLTPYAGRVVDLRFEYITDDAVNHTGLLLDDFSIPEIGYADDGEAGDGGWTANGFARIDNLLPQRYLVQAIELGDPVQVQRMALDGSNNGELVIPGLGDRLNRVVLVISGITPYTTEDADYRYQASLVP